MDLGFTNTNRTEPTSSVGSTLQQNPIDLYYTQLSSNCRAVMMVGVVLGVKFNVIDVNFGKREHQKPEVAMINPQEDVPFIKDNGFVLAESVAIMCYLAEKFNKNDTLYPTDLQKRALIHQKLCFDRGTLYERFADLYYPMYFDGARFDAVKKTNLDQGYTAFNTYLRKADPWVDGKHMTIADIALAATVSTAEAAGYDIRDYPRLVKWFEHAKKHIPSYDVVNQPGLDAFKYMVASMMKPKTANRTAA